MIFFTISNKFVIFTFFIHLFNKYYGSKNINAAEEVNRENKDSFPSKLSKIKEEKRKGIKLSETFVF